MGREKKLGMEGRKKRGKLTCKNRFNFPPHLGRWREGEEGVMSWEREKDGEMGCKDPTNIGVTRDTPAVTTLLAISGNLVALFCF